MGSAVRIGELFARNMTRHRQRLKLSQAKLADAIQASPGHVSLLERRQREPSFSTIDRLCAALQVPPAELFTVRPTNPESEGLIAEAVALLTDRRVEDLRMIVRVLRDILVHPAFTATAPSRARGRGTRRPRKRRGA